jgi:hypothetical protein
MRKSIKESIRETLQYLINNGSKTCFTDAELDRLGVKRKPIDKLLDKITPENIHKEINSGPPQGKEIW